MNGRKAVSRTRGWLLALGVLVALAVAGGVLVPLWTRAPGELQDALDAAPVPRSWELLEERTTVSGPFCMLVVTDCPSVERRYDVSSALDAEDLMAIAAEAGWDLVEAPTECAPTAASPYDGSCTFEALSGSTRVQLIYVSETDIDDYRVSVIATRR